MEHFKLQHPTLKPFKCEISGCNKMFPNRRNLNGHMITHESVRPTFKCPQCPQVFLNECSVAGHVRDLHAPPTLVFSCTAAGCCFTTTAARYLAAHEEVHAEIRRTFYCDHAGCASTFRYKLSLVLHQKNHARPHDKEFKCTECPPDRVYQTNRRAKLHSHLNEVHNNARPHACSAEGCMETFKRPAHLRVHFAVVHSGLRPFECNVEGCSYKTGHKQCYDYHATFKHDADGTLIRNGLEQATLTLVNADFSEMSLRHRINVAFLYDENEGQRHRQYVAVDASIRFSDKKLLVLLEVDEDQHKRWYYTQAEELERMQDATDALRETTLADDERVLWVRFNPSGSFRTAGGGGASASPPLAQRVAKLREFLLEYEPLRDGDDAQVAYMFYDAVGEGGDDDWVRVIDLPSS